MFVVCVALFASCGTETETTSESRVDVEEFGTWPDEREPGPGENPLAVLDDNNFLPVGPPGSATNAGPVALASAIGNLERVAAASEAPKPIGVSIGTLDVLAAPVRNVGVTADGEMEIPGASEVGWYEYGTRPGQPGSAVLAGHIAYNGENGVFLSLTELVAGDRVWVHFDDGSSLEFRIDALRQFNKEELPTDELFSESGAPRLALITCGGTFQPSLSTYEDNIVALASPV